jgi:hypothetical protein
MKFAREDSTGWAVCVLTNQGGQCALHFTRGPRFVRGESDFTKRARGNEQQK